MKLCTIICKENYSGLSKDKSILSSMLKENNMSLESRDIFSYKALSKQSILNIHLEVVDRRYFGKKNILIPNQEWFMKPWIKSLNRYDAIFCKSHYAVEIFRKYHPNVIYTGFTSIDSKIRKIKQLECFHASGGSMAKGTEFIAGAWNKTLPKLHLVSPHNIQVPSLANLNFQNKMLPEPEYSSLRNKCMVHIYPSQVEGFGHCINEAKSCGAVVITVDYPPMNELITDFLIPPDKIYTIPGRLGEIIYVKSSEITKAVQQLMEREDLKETGRKNRESFLKTDKEFKTKFMYEINKLLN